MTVKDIVTAYLKENGYDGLWDGDGECGCEIGDLMPCGGMDHIRDCQAGDRKPCDCGDHDWHIGRKE